MKRAAAILLLGVALSGCSLYRYAHRESGQGTAAGNSDKPLKARWAKPEAPDDDTTAIARAWANGDLTDDQFEAIMTADQAAPVNPKVKIAPPTRPRRASGNTVFLKVKAPACRFTVTGTGCAR